MERVRECSLLTQNFTDKSEPIAVVNDYFSAIKIKEFLETETMLHQIHDFVECKVQL